MNNVLQLPDLSQEYPLTTEQIKQYRQDGHLFLPGILSSEQIAAYRPQIVEFVMQQRAKLNAADQSVGGSPETFAFSLQNICEPLKQLLMSKRLGKIAADLMGVNAVRVLHYYGFFKPPGGPGTSWHQDSVFLPLDTDVITIWLPLVDVRADVAMTFANGSQTKGFLLDLGAMGRSNDEDPVRTDMQRRGYVIDEGQALQAGDADFHCGKIVHCAPANTCNYMREVIAICYYPDGAKLTNPKAALAYPGGQYIYMMQQHIYRNYFSHLKPGEAAISETNPIIYTHS
ncbi:phytanoyl-CoA dioxygenase family protein [Nostoc sp.]|uniref:phytanoyl-CoA dioxygenase family protein n=1 Tax=Nostoc sp. TaxID=1180 RepID=UPI002FFB5954